MEYPFGYCPTEERINVITHALGFVFSILAVFLLLRHAFFNGTLWHQISFGIFGFSLLLLYASSTLYHSSKREKVRGRLRIMDHAAIYVLIAGSYTPFTLITLQSDAIGWIMFGVIWGMAVIGIILKLFFTGKFDILSTLMYLFMGWMGVFILKPLIQHLPWNGVLWLFAGGAAYTLGAILFSLHKVRFNHAIFHILVLLGSLSHFVSVFYYVLPSSTPALG